MSRTLKPDIQRVSAACAASVDESPRENQKHDYRGAQKHYATCSMAIVCTLYWHWWSPPTD